MSNDKILTARHGTARHGTARHGTARRVIDSKARGKAVETW